MKSNQTWYLIGNTLLHGKEFVEKYGLCNKGLNPKHLKLGKYIEDVEVEKFKSCINKNNYRYFWLDDDEFIAKAENLRKTW